MLLFTYIIIVVYIYIKCAYIWLTILSYCGSIPLRYGDWEG